MKNNYVIGLDYGTNSVRCIIVDADDGNEIACSLYEYQAGKQGVIIDSSDHHLARQQPMDYIEGLTASVSGAVLQARLSIKGFTPDQIIAIGVDTTGSTPLPLDEHGTPLGMLDRFRNNPHAQAWLWKDHTAHVEAAEITRLAAGNHPEYLKRCGGAYSSEWFFSKILHCLRVAPEVYDAACTWVEHIDYMTGLLTGTTQPPGRIRRCRCAAGHKAMFNADWGGYPSREFLARLDPKLERLADTLGSETFTIDSPAGYLTHEWSRKLGIPAGIPVAMGAIDAHMGAVGAGIREGTLVKIIGTSTCDMVVSSGEDGIEVPGICGIVDGSILPGFWGFEAGQSAVGDIFNWFVNQIRPDGGSHEELTHQASQLRPGQSGLLGLDWNNGNRTVLIDQRLTGLLVGQTLHTTPAEIYRTLIEATAFGALTIINRFESYGVTIHHVMNCGGIAEKNPLLMQIYADVTGRSMQISRSSQTCALGSAIAAAVVAGRTRVCSLK